MMTIVDMKRARLPNSWLLLEQGEHFHEWTGQAQQDVLWITDGKVPVRGQSDTSFNEMPPFVCVLRRSLNPGGAAAPLTENLIRCLRVASDNGGLGIWCHYGGNLNLGRIEERWTTWPFLRESCKTMLSEFIKPLLFPHPFSTSQDGLPWHSGFVKLKQIVRTGCGTSQAQLYCDVHPALCDLQRQALNFLDSHKALQMLHGLGPVIFTVTSLMERIKSILATPVECEGIDFLRTIGYAAKLIRETGLAEMHGFFQDKDNVPRELKRLYRAIALEGHELNSLIGSARASYETQEAYEKALRSNTESFLRSLVGFYDSFAKRSRDLSQTLSKDSAAPSPITASNTIGNV